MLIQNDNDITYFLPENNLKYKNYIANECLIIDGNFLLCRMFYGFGDKCLENTYNFILKLRSKYNPEKFIIVFDTKNKDQKLRKTFYKDYKKDRKDHPNNFYLIKNKLEEILKLLNIPFIYSFKYEADDIIATLCNNFKNYNIKIIGKDMDLYPLLKNENIELLNNDDIINKDYIEDKYKISIDNFEDYLTFIKYIKGIGHKTAVKILNKEIYKKIDSGEFNFYKNNLLKLVNNIYIDKDFLNTIDYGVDSSLYFRVKEILDEKFSEN